MRAANTTPRSVQESAGCCAEGNAGGKRAGNRLSRWMPMATRTVWLPRRVLCLTSCYGVRVDFIGVYRAKRVNAHNLDGKRRGDRSRMAVGQYMFLKWAPPGRPGWRRP